MVSVFMFAFYFYTKDFYFVHAYKYTDHGREKQIGDPYFPPFRFHKMCFFLDNRDSSYFSANVRVLLIWLFNFVQNDKLLAVGRCNKRVCSIDLF